jgi:hypothetical protein
MKRLLGALLGLGLLAGVSATASATIIYTLDTNNAGFPTPVGTVALTLTDSTHATLVFTANTGANLFFVGGGDTAGANVNATSWTATASGDCASCTYADAGSGNIDGFGSFNQRFTSGNSSPGNRSTTVTINLVNTSGTWADEFSVLVNNNKGFQVGAHVGLCPNGIGGDCSTGDTTNGGPPVLETPEPGVLSLMALGLIALGVTTRRRRN